MLLKDVRCVDRGLQLLQFFEEPEILVPDFLIAMLYNFLIERLSIYYEIGTFKFSKVIPLFERVFPC